MTDHHFNWLRDDSIFLYKSNKKNSAILLLLCAIDAQSKLKYPEKKEVSARFTTFLKDRMRRPGKPQIHNIKVPKKNRLYSFEEIIYKFIRCPIVHEGTNLKAIDSDYEVCIDWQSIPMGLKVDQLNNKVILGGELIFNILIDAISDD